MTATEDQGLKPGSAWPIRRPVIVAVAALWTILPFAWSSGVTAGTMLALWLIGLVATMAAFHAPMHRAAPAAPDKLFRHVPHPVFELAPNGILHPLNPAARLIAARPARLDTVFADDDAGGQGAIYRLGRRAAEVGHCAIPICRGGRGGRLDVENLGTGRQLWRLLPEREAFGIYPRNPASDRKCDLEDLPVALARLDGQGRLRFLNEAARKLLGDAAVPGVRIDTLLEGLGKPMADRVAETRAGRAQGRSEVACGTTDHADGFLQVTMTRMNGADGPEIVVVMSDATELKTLEAQFVQSQKMQAVGQLAGGIAHDFNNLLTAINGHCDLLLLRHLQGDADHSDLMQVRQNANRAAALVRQLLAFSRKQTLRPEVLHLYDTLAELANLLNRLLGERVELRIDNCEDIWPVRVDERQLEQVIVNLVVNARDAMPDGGTVCLRTCNMMLDAPLRRDRAVLAPGRYSVIEVEDTGTGIPKEVIAKIFEPFFTTKKVGEGTGLGLSTAYGIIKQMDGFIFVDSTPGTGALFRIYLPAHEPVEAEAEPLDEPAPQPPKLHVASGRGVVLLVEDEAPVRAFAARALQMRGYTVLEADCGEAALALLEDPHLRVDLFVSDVVMPGMDGPAWVRKAYEARPDATTVFVSGYSEDTFADGQAVVPRSSYLAKPFSLEELVGRVREHMDRYVE